ncbi:MAG: hypothetical protein KAX25_05565 [Dehalococcoidia bacterium]|nr:hypothetical protein [Dehalococcoidia bacterium]
MNDLSDYSGEFNPNIRLEDFSKDFLLKLLELYSRLFLAIDGFWYLAVKKRAGNEEALSCDMWAWKKEVRYEMKRLRELLGIQGNDVVTLMKALQLTPFFQNVKCRIATTDRNHAVLTVTHCPTLEALEKEGEGRERGICKSIDATVFQEYADFVNPDIEARYLKLPPRQSKDEICCQWEFALR